MESDTNYSKVEVTWEPMGNNSRVDLFWYHIIYLGRASSEANTTNTTVILSGLPHNTNISFVVYAGNCAGKSAPVTLIMNVGNNGKSA